MARATHAEAQIPATGSEDVPYADHRAIARSLMGHAAECFVGQVTGAGGAGDTLANVPFNPGVIMTFNEAGAAPSVSWYAMLATPIGVQTILAVADATSEAPAVTDNGDGTFDVLMDTADAPDGEVATVVCFGVRDTDGGL